MSKGKTPQLPATPEFFSDPRFQGGIDNMMGLGNRLTRFDFTGDLSPLQDTISLDPEVTKLALQYAQNSLNPAFNDTIKGLKNEAANAGSLESSTFTDALATAGQNLNSQFQAITAQAGLDDRSRALQNRIDLFGTGLNIIGSATGYAGQNQEQKNQFNLDNYSNIVAKSINDNQKRLGTFGQIASFISPLAHDYNVSQGYVNTPGYGVADIANIASDFMPGNGGTAKAPSSGGVGTTPYIPRSSASNNPFQQNAFLKQQSIFSGGNPFIG